MHWPSRRPRRQGQEVLPLLLVQLLLLLLPHAANAFFHHASSSFSFRSTASRHCTSLSMATSRRGRSLEMRDASMVRDFEVGDYVRIVPNVKLDGCDWGGLEGTVTSTWEKCEVDPHCCCAELGTEGPIRVDFQVGTTTANTLDRLGGKATNYNFFGENELIKLSSSGKQKKQE